MNEIQRPPETFEEIRERPEAGIPRPERFVELLREYSSEEHAQAYEKVLDMSRAFKEAGGRALLVGGSVRDLYFGKISKDFDVEVYGLEPEKILEIAKAHGRVDDVGDAFAVLKITFGSGIDIDLSLPRTDSKMSEAEKQEAGAEDRKDGKNKKRSAHTDFNVKADPYMSIQEAARRRDFTMNAMGADPLTGEVFDYYGGIEDIKHHRLVVTDGVRFQDDPLRVLRAVQFVGRFGLNIDSSKELVVSEPGQPEVKKNSFELMQEMVPLLKDIPKERHLEEWKKLMLKSELPSVGLQEALRLGVLEELHEELYKLKETPQDPGWHPEGDVWIHSIMAVNEAARICRLEGLEKDEAWVQMLTALCHDLGKPDVTEVNEKGRITSKKHEPEGAEPANRFMESLGVDKKTQQKVVKLVESHLAPSMLYIADQKAVSPNEKVSDGAIRRLAARIHPATITELVRVAKADHLGRGPFRDPVFEDWVSYPEEFPAEQWLLERAQKVNVEDGKPKPLVGGKDLIELKFKPSNKAGERFGEVMALTDDLRDDGEYTREQIIDILRPLSPDTPKAIAELQKLVEKVQGK
ncbi:MAG: HD domain-containing protein [Patescibacteria group bacterium]